MICFIYPYSRKIQGYGPRIEVVEGLWLLCAISPNSVISIISFKWLRAKQQDINLGGSMGSYFSSSSSVEYRPPGFGSSTSKPKNREDFDLVWEGERYQIASVDNEFDTRPH